LPKILIHSQCSRAAPTYKALCELGKALKTPFLCDYLLLESLRRYLEAVDAKYYRWHKHLLFELKCFWFCRRKVQGGKLNSFTAS